MWVKEIYDRKLVLFHTGWLHLIGLDLDPIYLGFFRLDLDDPPSFIRLNIRPLTYGGSGMSRWHLGQAPP